MISDVVHAQHLLETTQSLLAIALNSFLLYLILQHSDYVGRIYQVCLAIDASLDLALGMASLVAQPVGWKLPFSVPSWPFVPFSILQKCRDVLIENGTRTVGPR